MVGGTQEGVSQIGRIEHAGIKDGSVSGWLAFGTLIPLLHAVACPLAYENDALRRLRVAGLRRLADSGDDGRSFGGRI